MGRSSKKGPFIDQKLLKKVLIQKQTGRKEPIKTWARACQIPPEFVGHSFQVHNGRIFTELYVTEMMVGHRLGEFSPTRTFRGHGRMVKRTVTKT
ncbi:30S ribosomal protein S19 [Candidatus Beckwithbacteria bacterium CG10_big_fil_rev_8_21_14_0_10_34_10]|uniref:Small ribosomal subunit protein uS19 n=1 Tax=Candidatus Beckwithbacteria bacterium CG10_big_fil_rev_8_21_14_0_10_34_10 TaxID=1974495 RepID=A0A2H0W7S4_9BACT|nr:MAG: 30S ribosomal protein S19 [Candidatus Beckwithbacteria bacterium CG10_big_fil_rev_8_21_14_0_10_34_10]